MLFFRCTVALLILVVLGFPSLARAGAEGSPFCAAASEDLRVSNGPDIIVGNLLDARLWGMQSGIASLSVGTVACNMGNERVSWLGQSPNHPVISQGLYRLKGGRMEQIGLAWLKHGFVAGAENACGLGCQDPGTFTQLGVGCSDPYDSIINGDQRGMGPRSEVNPATGSVVYPFTTLLQTGDVLYKRLQAKTADIAPASNPGARYFAEALYLAADDAAAGNDLNNVSTRELSFDGSFNPTLLDVTKQGKSALEVWREIDPSVAIASLDLSGDGRFQLATKVIDNGNGTWRYEYALYNMNSHLGARRFSIPIPAGTQVTNIGFHDVDYHSGEAFEGEDWEATVGGGVVVWQTESEASNPNANALRFGTTYNFWFDANKPPTSATAAIAPFRASSFLSAGVLSRGPGADTSMLLRNGRFRVEAMFRQPQGQLTSAHAVQLTDDTGYFWFFVSSNVELVVKALNGCGVNGRFWIFSAGLTNVEVDLKVTDLVSGQIKHYTNPLGTAYPPKLDTNAFATCSAAADSEADALAGLFDDKATNATELLLRNDRFRVTATFRTPGGTTQTAQAVELTDDTGYFYFFNPANVEAVVKVLNACGVNQRYWVFAAGLTNVEMNITVFDTLRTTSKTYTNLQGTAFAPIQDTAALATCP